MAARLAATQTTSRAYAIKAAIIDARAECFTFVDQKTMYGGKAITIGDAIYLFASENAGGLGLFAQGVVEAVSATPRLPNVARQTPRVSIEVRRIAKATRPLGRRELKAFAGVTSPEGKLHFKFYRQATDKIVGLSAATAAFLDTFF